MSMSFENIEQSFSCLNSLVSLKILLVDDDPDICELYKQCLINDTERLYAISEVGLGGDGIKVCESNDFDCILLDYQLPDINGVDFLNLLDKETKQKTPIIMLSGQGDELLVTSALQAGAMDYLPKRVVTTQSLNRTISNAIEKLKLRNAVENQSSILVSKNKELSRKNDEIQRFYQTVSHELKTPLTSIKEFVSIISDELAGPINDEQREYLGLVEESCMQMANDINDLLDLTRLETGKYRVELELNDIEPTINHAVSMMKVIAKNKQIYLQVEIDKNLPLVVIDPKRIDQILVNLLSNAIKFTEKGGDVAMQVKHVFGESECIKVSVTDTGCGMSPESLRNIFDRLYQVNPEQNANDSSTSLGGLGLGLNICQELIRLHDGAISVKSKEGEGSTFSFTLPVCKKS